MYSSSGTRGRPAFRWVRTSSASWAHSSSGPNVRFVELQYVDGLGEFPARQGQERSLRRVPHVLSCAFARLPGRAELRVGAVGLFATPELRDGIRVEYQEDDSSCT